MFSNRTELIDESGSEDEESDDVFEKLAASMLALQSMDNSSYEFHANLPKSLQTVIGTNYKSKKEFVDTKINDWKAPAHPGLGNSKPILAQKRATTPQKNPVTNNNLKSSKTIKPAQRINEDVEDDSEEDDDDDGDDDDFNNGINRLVNMSAGVRAALGLTVDNSSTLAPIDWKPPSISGLKNSDPIIPTKINQIPVVHDEDNEEDDEEDDEDYVPLEATAMSNELRKALGLPLNITATAFNTNNTSATSDWKPPSRPGLNNSTPIFPTISSSTGNNYQKASNATVPFLRSSSAKYSSNSNSNYSNNDEDEEEDGEDEEEDDDEEEEDNDAIPTRVAMSQSLMKALGLTVNDEKEMVTDWKPPDRAGLDNSRPLIVMVK